MGPCAIARKLNREGVVTPGEYCVRRGTRKAGGEGGSSWSAGKVSAILDREAYVGTLVAGKRTRSKVGAQTKVECAPDDWVRVEDAWEPLVSKEVFDRAQRVLRPRTAKPLLLTVWLGTYVTDQSHPSIVCLQDACPKAWYVCLYACELNRWRNLSSLDLYGAFKLSVNHKGGLRLCRAFLSAILRRTHGLWGG